jgi:hypothetical protein
MFGLLQDHCRDWSSTSASLRIATATFNALAFSGAGRRVRACCERHLRHGVPRGRVHRAAGGSLGHRTGPGVGGYVEGPSRAIRAARVPGRARPMGTCGMAKMHARESSPDADRALPASGSGVSAGPEVWACGHSRGSPSLAPCPQTCIAHTSDIQSGLENQPMPPRPPGEVGEVLGGWRGAMRSRRCCFPQVRFVWVARLASHDSSGAFNARESAKDPE